MNNLKSLLTNIGLGCAATFTIIGVGTQKPNVADIGIGLGILSSTGKIIEQNKKQQQNIDTLISIQNQIIEQQENYSQKQEQLSFKVDNTQLQLKNHSKKLKKQQHNIQACSRNQNTVTSQIKKLDSKQKQFVTQHHQTMSEIKAQVDKQAEIARCDFPKVVKLAKKTPKKIVPPIVSRIPQNRVYIDHNNFYSCLKAMEIEPDYQALMIKLTAKTGKTQIRLYDGAFERLTTYQEQKYLHLKKLGYQIFTFPIVKRDRGNFKTVGDDVQLAIDMVKDVKSGDHVVLITGDGDLYPAVREIQQRQAHVTVIAMNSSVNRHLRNLADRFISLDSIKYDIAKYRPVSA